MSSLTTKKLIFSVIDGETCKKAKSPDIGFLGEVMSQHSL